MSTIDNYSLDKKWKITKQKYLACQLDTNRSVLKAKLMPLTSGIILVSTFDDYYIKQQEQSSIS